MSAILWPLKENIRNYKFIIIQPGKRHSDFQVYLGVSNRVHRILTPETPCKNQGLIFEKSSTSRTGYEIKVIFSRKENCLKPIFLKLNEAEGQNELKAFKFKIEKKHSISGDNIQQCTQEYIRKQFLKLHNNLFRKEKNSMFGWFRRTKVNSTWTFEQIIEHAQKSSNRSRSVLRSMQLMDNKGHAINMLKDALISKRSQNHQSL